MKKVDAPEKNRPAFGLDMEIYRESGECMTGKYETIKASLSDKREFSVEIARRCLHELTRGSRCAII
jgi:hypothetical protein